MDLKKICLGFILIGLLFISPLNGFAAESKVIAYYFHGNQRCPTCHKLEKYTKESIEANFKDELDRGTLQLQTVNVEQKENKHFIKDYQLYTKTLIISQQENGKEIKYKNLDKIWEYVSNKNEFMDYVVSEIKEFLNQ